MSLSSALNSAKSSLSAIQTQTALVSRNIANANTEGATVKYATVVTGSGGRVEIRSITQSSNATLFRNMLESSSSLAQSTAVQNGLDRISELVGDIENGQTPAAVIGDFVNALNAYKASPNKYEFARTAADAAKNVVAVLNNGTATVDTIRRDADDELVSAASDMTKLLAQIHDLNEQVVSGTISNQDVTDLADKRDQAVAQLAQYVGVTVNVRANNDIAIYTDSGVNLFDKVPRNISYDATHPLADGQAGNGFRIDGILVTGDNALMPIKSGKIAGLVELRDKLAVTYQSQLDEMARGLIAATAERPATGSDIPGIFTSVDLASLKTTSRVDVGTFAAGGLTNGNVISFDLQLGATTYKVSGDLSTADLASSAAFATRLQAMINGAVPVGGTGTLGSGHVAVEENAGKLTLSADGVGSKLALGISNLTSKASTSATVNDTTAKTGGLFAVSADVSQNAIIPGLARLIGLSSTVSSNASSIRDGVTADYNTNDLGGFTDRLNAITTALTKNQGFSAGSDAATSGSLTAFASSSVSWLQDKRSDATKATEYRQTLLDQTKTTLSSATGIDLNTESLKMLDLERSYQASSKVLTTVNEMLKTLMDAI